MATLRPQCGQPFSEYKMCEECCIFITNRTVYDLYNYDARYHRLDHFRDVLRQFMGREGKQFPPKILYQIRHELPMFSETTAVDVKKAMRELKLTKFIKDFYYIMFAMTGGNNQNTSNAESKTASSGCSKYPTVFTIRSTRRNAKTS